MDCRLSSFFLPHIPLLSLAINHSTPHTSNMLPEDRKRMSFSTTQGKGTRTTSRNVRKAENQKLLLKICSGATWNNLSVCSTTRRVRRKKVYEEAAHWKAHRQDSAREGASLRVCPTLSFVSAAPKLKYASWHQATIYRQKRSCRSQDGEPQYEEKRRHANIVFFFGSPRPGRPSGQIASKEDQMKRRCSFVCSGCWRVHRFDVHGIDWQYR